MEKEDIARLVEDSVQGFDIGEKMTLREMFWQVMELASMTWQGQLLYDFCYNLKSRNFDKAYDLILRFPLFFLVMFFGSIFGAYMFQLVIQYLFGGAPEASSKKEPEPRVEIPDPRDFTEAQLRAFDGIKSPSIYVALKGDVFDVTQSSDFYGKEGPYHCFAGRNATRAMAKLSFEEADLSNPRIDDLGPFERDTLEDWISKFKHYKQYPIVGKLSTPPEPRNLTVADLSEFKGKQPAAPNRVHPSILVALKGVVYDVSYGGYDMYREGSGYHVFAGKDASRGLAKMSLAEEECSSSNLSDLTEAQLKTLDEWVHKFSTVRKYPVVGHIAAQ